MTDRPLDEPAGRGVLASLSLHGKLSFRIRREGEVLIAEWPDIGELRAHASGTWSEFAVAPGVDPARAQKLKDGVVSAMVRHIEGKLSLHGSAMAIHGIAIVCLGEPGAGKSTAAADLGRRAGVAFIADDAASLDIGPTSIDVLPSRELHWLTGEARAAIGEPLPDDPSHKAPLDPRAKVFASVPLGALIELSFDDSLGAPRAEPIRGSDRFRVLHAAMFRFVIDQPEANVRDFGRLIDLADRVPMFAVKRPRALERLAATSDLLVALSRGRAP